MTKMIRRMFLTGCLILIFLLSACGGKGSDNGSADQGSLKDGTYEVYVDMEGGSGRASITSPTELQVKNGQMTARIEWSSNHYDYMIVGEEKYLPTNTEGNSVFEVPVAALDQTIDVVADTTAMSTAHEIAYKLTFSMEEDNEGEENVDSASPDRTKGLNQALDPQTISKELTFDHSMELQYAKHFKVDYYQDGYALIQITDEGAFLMVPEGKEVPGDLSSEIRIIQQPIHNVYLVASAVMDMFRSIDALDQIRFSGTKEDKWYIPEVVAAMKSGNMLYAGKYSAPDYEKIMAEKCNLVIENTMIYHTPAVKEQLERFGICVMVDHSSYEEEPLGRTEWVKLYGLLSGKEEEAKEAFDDQIAEFASIDDQKKENATVAFFYFTNDGQVNVRRSSDYLPKMIEMAGGEYIFKDLGEEEESAASTLSMQMEAFYAAAKEADYMIYNSTTVGEIETLADLLKKNELLSKCKAVENHQVFCTSNNLYQSSMELGTIIGDFHKMLKGDVDTLTYLYPLK
ncbi:MAG: ABC transporter substrate-binding protein [Eubacteriales bacterium]|nr:ABC transporter substrate-binding protein [Eubacteriales bacterium]